MQARHLLAVDAEKIVAFPEPAVLGQRDGEHRADVYAPAFQMGDLVVAAGRRRILPAKAGVEVRGVGRHLVHLHPIHLPVKPGGAVGVVVGHHDPGRFAEGHAPVARHRAGRRHLDRDALDHGRLSLPHREEIAQRRLDSRFLPAVPVDPQAEGVELTDPAGVACHPDVGNHPGTFEDRHVDRLAGPEPGHVEVGRVPFGLLIARDAAVADARTETGLRPRGFGLRAKA